MLALWATVLETGARQDWVGSGEGIASAAICRPIARLSPVTCLCPVHLEAHPAPRPRRTFGHKGAEPCCLLAARLVDLVA